MTITDNQFKRIIKQFDSENLGINLFMKYSGRYGRGSFIDTLDTFAHLMGIDFNVDTISSRYPIPYFVYREGNILGKSSGSSKYQDLRLKSYADAQKIIVKEFFEMLSFVDIKKFNSINKIQALEELL